MSLPDYTAQSAAAYKANIDETINNSLKPITTGGTGDAYTVSLGITAYEAGRLYLVWFDRTNTTTTPTLNIDNLGAVSIRDGAMLSLKTGAIREFSLGVLKYDGTYFLYSDISKYPTFTNVEIKAVNSHLKFVETDATDPNDFYLLEANNDNFACYFWNASASLWVLVHRARTNGDFEVAQTGGLIAGNPTGGSKGAGTANAEKIYVQGTEVFVGRGVLVTRTVDWTAPSYTANTFVSVPWDSESYDTDTIHSTVTNSERCTVPAGVSKVRVSASCTISGIANYQMWILKNGVSFTGAFQIVSSQSRLYGTTPVIPVTPGDYFEIQVAANSSTLSVLNSGSWVTWASMELVA